MSGVKSALPVSDRPTRSRLSGRPHRSMRGAVDPAANGPGGDKAKAKANCYSTTRTSWTAGETDEFIRLLFQHSSAGENSLKEVTFNLIAEGLNKKFPGQGVAKTGRSCRSKWSNIKSEYTLVSSIKSASGIHYDDINGVVVDNATRAAWARFRKSHPRAAKYENNPWPYWNDVSLLIHTIPKQTRALTRAKPGSKHIGTLPSQPSNVATDDGPTIGEDPNTIPPKPPSTFLAWTPSEVSSLMTSVSQKRTTSSISESDIESAQGSVKRPCAFPEAAPGAEIDVLLQQLSNFIDPSVLDPVTLASLKFLGFQPPPPPAPSDSDDIKCAVELLTSFNLDPSEMIDVASYLCEPENEGIIKFFLEFNTPTREIWIRDVLAKTRTKRDDEQEKRSTNRQQS